MLTNNNKLAVFATLFVLPVVCPYEFPTNFIRCHLADLNLDSCLKSAIQNAIHLIKTTGIPSLHLHPIDPLETDHVTLEEGSSIQLRQKYTDVKITGITNCTVENAHFDLDAKKLTFTVFMPKLQQKAKYEMNGKVLILPVYGKGDSVITGYNATLVSQLSFEEETRDEDVYFILKSYKLKTFVQHVEFSFTNLFDGNELLADNVLKVLNDQSGELYNDVSQTIDKCYGDLLYNVIADFFKNIPFKYILMQ